MLSNADIYLAIAQEAHASMRAELAKVVKPKPDGTPGYIMRFEPDRRSFKDAMVTVVFAGIYLEALLYLSLRNRFGRADALKIDRDRYEDRLKRLGVTDTDLLQRVAAFREARRDLVHEKAVAPDELESHTIRIAQDTADNAISLLQDIRRLLIAGLPSRP